MSALEPWHIVLAVVFVAAWLGALWLLRSDRRDRKDDL